MASDSHSDEGNQHKAEPPEAGRTTEASMRRAAHDPLITGRSGSAGLAAGGGLELPGARPDDESREDRLAESAGGGLIPGARESDTLTHREPGAMSGQFNGVDVPGAHADLLNEMEKVELYREGGLDLKTATRKARER